MGEICCKYLSFVTPPLFVDIGEKCSFCESKIFLEENAYTGGLLQD